MKLTLSIDDIFMTRLWADTSNRTHHVFKGHIGSMISLGDDMIVSSSMKNKIDSKSLRELELVFLGDNVSMTLWCLYFIETQGCTMKQIFGLQDKPSTMRLAVSRSLLSSNLTKNTKDR